MPRNQIEFEQRTLDGLNFTINIPFIIDRKWFLYKYKGAGLRYETCLSLKKSWTVCAYDRNTWGQ